MNADTDPATVANETVAEDTATNLAVDPDAPTGKDFPVETEPLAFPADYVTELRAEAAQHRTRAKALTAELVAAWAAADGRLVDPTDLPASAVDLTDDGTVTRDAVTAAIDALVKSKPHLAAQRPAPLPQGARPQADQVSLMQLLQGR
jgi:hypothetical protein